MMKISKIFLFLYLSFNLFNDCLAQENVFDSLKHYTYDAIFTSKDGLVINEKITLNSTGKPWKYQSTQFECNITYFPNDSLLKFIPDPTNKTKKWKSVTSHVNHQTGFIENSRQVWMHPFRANQYIYTEVAPFPEIFFDSIGNPIMTWKGGLFILNGWGKFKGKLKTSYNLKGKTAFEFNGEILTECWQIEAKGSHSKLGESSINYIFSKKYGFIKMNYVMYDGTLIDFKLINVIQK